MYTNETIKAISVKQPFAYLLRTGASLIVPYAQYRPELVNTRIAVHAGKDTICTRDSEVLASVTEFDRSNMTFGGLVGEGVVRAVFLLQYNQYDARADNGSFFLQASGDLGDYNPRRDPLAIAALDVSLYKNMHAYVLFDRFNAYPARVRAQEVAGVQRPFDTPRPAMLEDHVKLALAGNYDPSVVNAALPEFWQGAA